MIEHDLSSRIEKKRAPIEYYEFIDKNSLRYGFLEDVKRRWISTRNLFIENISAVHDIYNKNSKSIYTVTRGEEKLLSDHKNEIEQYVDKRKLVFWGAGRKEAYLTNMVNVLKPASQNAIVIDVEKTYIEDMANEITPSKNVSPLVGIQALFESFLEDKPKQFLHTLVGKQPAIQVCLGATIGNFRQHEIFRVFQMNTKADDYLLLGIQLENDPEKIFREYAENDEMRRFAQLQEFIKLEKDKIGKHSWNYNYEKHQIEYLFTFEKDHSFGKEEGLSIKAGEQIEILRSKKYQLPALLEELKRYGFSYETDFQEDDKCLLLVKRQNVKG